MILVNEAWNILGDSEKKANYDAFLKLIRTGKVNSKNHEQVKKNQKEAREKAIKSPITWKNVDKVLSRVRSDFNKTQYHGTDLRDSKSGRIIFYIVGVIGALIGIWVLFFINDDQTDIKGSRRINSGHGKSMAIRALVIAVPIIAYSMHRLIGFLLNLRIESNYADLNKISTKKKIISCNACGQKIRSPALYKEINIRCPSCSSEFSMYGKGNLVYTNFDDNKDRIKDIPRWLYITICTVCLIIIATPFVACILFAR